MKQLNLEGKKSDFSRKNRKHRCLNCGGITPKNIWVYCSLACKNTYRIKMLKYQKTYINGMRSQILENNDLANRITAGQELTVTDAIIKTTDDGNKVCEFTDIEGNKWGTFASQVIGFVNGKFKEHLKSVIETNPDDGLDLYFYEGTANTGRKMLKVSLFKQ